MIDQNIRRAIIEFIEREYKLPEDTDYDSFNYVENGYVDSMGLVQFVTILEDDFDVEFTSEELLSKEFKTIGGLEKIILSKIAKR